MEQSRYEQALKDKIAPKFRGKEVLPSKVVPQFPHNVEREYLRLVNGFMGKFDKVLRAHMPALKAALEAEQPLQMDAAPIPSSSVPKSAGEVISDIERDWSESLLSYDLRRRLERIANMNRKLTIAEWNRVMQKTLGINLLEDYYSGDFFADIIPQWVAENVDLIVTQPKNILGRMREIIQESHMQGGRVEHIARDINETYGMGKRHARLIARDQTAKLNGDISRKQQQDAGVNIYIWDTSRDQRVRETHRRMRGLYCRWDDVNVYSETGEEGSWKPKAANMANIRGKFVHVEQDYQCRCTPRAVFTLAGFKNVPVAAVDWKSIDNRYQDRIWEDRKRTLLANGWTVSQPAQK